MSNGLFSLEESNKIPKNTKKANYDMNEDEEDPGGVDLPEDTGDKDPPEDDSSYNMDDIENNDAATSTTPDNTAYDMGDENQDSGDDNNGVDGDTNNGDIPDNNDNQGTDTGDNEPDPDNPNPDDTGEDYNMDDDNQDPADGDTGDTGADDTGDTVDETNPDEVENELKKLEDEILFADMDKDSKNIRDKELTRLFVNMYNSISSILIKLNLVPRNESNIDILEFSVRKLTTTRTTIYDYIIDTYKTKSYIENTAMYYEFIAIIEKIHKLIEDYVKKDEE